MKPEDLSPRIGADLAKIRETKPLIHQITNYVVMNDTANVTLQLGALPVMAHAQEEVAEMVRCAGALVLNPGTLEPSWVTAMILAGQEAKRCGVPVVLDPVGAGATTYRTQSNLRLIAEVQPTIVRGNAGEIGALIGAGGEVRGVESVGEVGDVPAIAKQAAQAWGATVAITGARDHITDGTRSLAVDNGNAWLTTLTGTGCTSTTVVAAFAAVESDPVIAAAGALACLGYAAELAEKDTHGPGSFRVALHDALYNLTPEALSAGARVTVL
ncbi:hydroxyethylthiazole kinase [bacterium]|nr:hydroxyethylthiazole kinase [bacterium]